MSKKDYVKIAAVIARWRQHNTNELGDVAVLDVTLDLAAAFTEDNPRFDRVQFLRAVGGESGK